MEAEGMSLEQLAFLLSKYNRKRNYYRLKSGQFVAMEESSLDTLAQLSQGLMADGRTTCLRTHFPAKIPCLVSGCTNLRDNESLPVNKSREFRELIRNMKTVEDSDFEVPDAFRKILREYQKRKGIYGWQHYAAMGLAVFWQMIWDLERHCRVIVFLYDHYIVQGENNRNTLIVCPASLVYNWCTGMSAFCTGSFRSAP